MQLEYFLFSVFFLRKRELLSQMTKNEMTRHYPLQGYLCHKTILIKKPSMGDELILLFGENIMFYILGYLDFVFLRNLQILKFEVGYF